MDQKHLLGMSINCGWFVKKSFVLPTLCTSPSLLLLIVPLYGLININCQYLALMSCKKSHFEICHLKYFPPFYFGHFLKWNRLLYSKIQSKPKGLYLYIS